MKAEEIWEVLPYRMTDKLRREVALALEYIEIDSEVVEFACDHLFITSIEEGNGTMIPNYVIGRRDVIVLPDESGEEYQRTILHEIAHAYLGHRDTSLQVNNDLHRELYDKQETEAWGWVDSWLRMKESLRKMEVK